METAIEQRAGLLGCATPHEGQKERVLDDLALGAAAADANDVLGNGLERADAANVVLLRKRENTAAYGRHDRTRRQLALLDQLGEGFRAPPERLLVPRGSR